MMSEADIINSFNSKTKELVESRFAKSIQNSGINISGTKGQPIKAVRNGPDLEDIKSVAVTYRLFTLDGDGISIREIAKLYEKLYEKDDLRVEFNKIREALNNFLNTNSIIEFGGKALTNGKIIDRYLYGHLIHLNKKVEFESWIHSSPLNELVYNEIVNALAHLINFIVFIDSVNQEYIKRIS